MLHTKIGTMLSWIQTTYENIEMTHSAVNSLSWPYHDTIVTTTLPVPLPPLCKRTQLSKE